jgi:hypothetical protein
MSEEIIEEKPEAVSAPEPAPAIKEPTLAEQIEFRAVELRKYKGKFFRQKGNAKSPIVEIIDYGGVKSKIIASDGQIVKQEAHTFIAEMHGARWTPAATSFLETYEEVEAPVKSAKSQLPI